VLRRHAARAEHRCFVELLDVLDPGDLLVVNDTSVVPARLYGEKASTGGQLECLLVRRLDDIEEAGGRAQRFVCLLQASKKTKPGTRITFHGAGVGDVLVGQVEAPIIDEAGAFVVRFFGDVLAFARAYGHVPLPPYIVRSDDVDDTTRYQTVFHDENKAGSSAAPTAGLHFDDALLSQLATRGVRTARVTLHVGPGTFLPVREGSLRAHTMHAEPWWVPAETADLVRQTKAAGRRVVAVGTTSLRALESSVDGDGQVRAGEGLTRLFLVPGVPIRSADALITNFHLPKSTLFVLVCAFAGWSRMHAAYAAAVAERYRFFSYGDASFLERAP
jgi:S-adenosylmethionine:tRNA ribosyltransferase-isomerase